MQLFNIVLHSTTIQVSTNGALSLGDDATTLVNVKFPQSIIDKPLIAPFLADVDTTSAGNVYYRLSSSSSDLEYANEHIRNIGTFANDFYASQVVVVTWDSVGYFRNNSDKVD